LTTHDKDLMIMFTVIMIIITIIIITQ